MSVSIDVIDNTGLDEVIDRLQSIDDLSVKIGVLSRSGKELLLIANVQEFGAVIPVTDKMRGFFAYEFGVNLRRDTTEIVIPERSYIRAGFDENENEIFKTIEDLFGLILDGDITANDFYQLIGNEVANSIKEYLLDVTKPKLSSLTIANKGSSNPLVDSGRLMGAITYEVVDV